MRNLMLVVFALVLVAGMANAQINASTADFYGVTVANGLTVVASPGQIDGLVAGYTYTVDPDVNNPNPISPMIGGNEAIGSIMQFTITSAAGASVDVTFNLPKFLTGATAGTIPCSFAANSVYDELTGGRFNPNAPFVAGTPFGGGDLVLDLGITVSVPNDVLDGDQYQGLVTINVAPTGL